MNKEIIGKNSLDKYPILTGKEPPKIIGITEKQYYEYKKLKQDNKQLKTIIKTLIKEYDLYPTEYVKNLIKGDGDE